MSNCDVNVTNTSLDFTELEKKYLIKEENIFLNTLIICNIPIVDTKKESKILALLNKIFSKTCKIKENGIFMPMKDGNSLGFLFITLETTTDAEKLIKEFDGYKLDKSHVFEILPFDEYESLLNMDLEYKAPQLPSYVEKGNLNDWLLDPFGRDQYCTLVGEEVSIQWNMKKTNPEVCCSRPNWTETFVKWSPLGSYLVSFHKQGVALWGTNEFVKCVRFVHAGVKSIEFSPCERYIATFINVSKKEDTVRIWDVKSGKLLRSFSDNDPIKWSFDGNYISKAISNSIVVYELPSFVVFDKIKIDGELQDYSWSPKSHHISYWTPESGNTPARVCVNNVTDKSIVRTKNIFQVGKIQLFWQSNGDYLIAKVEKITKSKKTLGSSLEIFCLKQPQIPIEVVDSLKEKIILNVYWEPGQHKFIVVSQEGLKTFVSFYKMDKVNCSEVKTVERKINHVFWSPKGRIVILAFLGKMQGLLEFWDSEDIVMINSVDHDCATDIEWDPSGRTVVSSVSMWKCPSENGYLLLDFRGQTLLKRNIQKFKQILWRPRQPFLLSKDEMKKIRKNLKKYSDIYEKEDSKISGLLAQKNLLSRKKLVDEWRTWRTSCGIKYNEERDKRAVLRGNKTTPLYSDEEFEETLVFEKEIELDY